jgi:two-component system sensor histidine kinase UhpB
MVVLGLALVATLLGNWLLLHRRFIPLDRLISAMEQIDQASPDKQLVACDRVDSSEAHRLEAAINRMLRRLEAARLEAGRAAIQAQERERRRIAQDPEVVGERTQRRGQSLVQGDEVPGLFQRHADVGPAAVLDDLGLLPALKTQVRDFADQTGIQAAFNVTGPVPDLAPEQQLVVYRVTQESLSNVAQHSGAGNVDVELSFEQGTRLRIVDDGRGFTSRREGGLGLSGMRERALLAGGQLSIWSADGQGTRVELTLA